MLRRLVSSFAILLLLLFHLHTPAFGWNKATHMVTGSLTYRDLQKTSPQTLARVVDILRQHPEYGKRWAARLNESGLTESEKQEYLFMLAARWADDIRGETAYDRPTWHFINYVYAPEQGMARTDTTLASGENILQAFEANRQILRGQAPDSVKAVALCWLFHLAGDVHMPLHTAALVGARFPQGDKGGNLFRIRVMMSNQTTNLHSFWDGMLLGTDDFRSVQALSSDIGQAVARQQLAQLGKTDITSWSKESFQLAQDNAYRSNTLKPGTEEEGTPLPEDYVATVKPIARRQVALAGYRLADELAAAL